MLVLTPRRRPVRVSVDTSDWKFVSQGSPFVVPAPCRRVAVQEEGMGVVEAEVTPALRRVGDVDASWREAGDMVSLKLAHVIGGEGKGVEVVAWGARWLAEGDAVLLPTPAECIFSVGGSGVHHTVTLSDSKVVLHIARAKVVLETSRTVDLRLTVERLVWEGGEEEGYLVAPSGETTPVIPNGGGSITVPIRCCVCALRVLSPYRPTGEDLLASGVLTIHHPPGLPTPVTLPLLPDGVLEGHIEPAEVPPPLDPPVVMLAGSYRAREEVEEEVVLPLASESGDWEADEEPSTDPVYPHEYVLNAKPVPPLIYDAADPDQSVLVRVEGVDPMSDLLVTSARPPPWTPADDAVRVFTAGEQLVFAAFQGDTTIGHSTYQLPGGETGGPRTVQIPLVSKAREVGSVTISMNTLNPSNSSPSCMERLERCPDLLEVTVVKATDLQDEDTLGKSDPFVELVASGHPTYQTPVKDGTLNPTWDYPVAYELRGNAHLKVEMTVWDSDPVGKDFLGYAELNVIPSLVQQALRGPQKMVLRLGGRPGNEADGRYVAKKNGALGMLVVSVSAMDKGGGAEGGEGGGAGAGAEGGRAEGGKEEEPLPEGPPPDALELTIVRATDLPDADTLGASDPFVECFVEGEEGGRRKERTAVQDGTLNPTWNHTVVLELGEERARLGGVVVLDVLDSDPVGSDFLGRGTLRVTPRLLWKALEEKQRVVLELGPRAGNTKDAKLYGKVKKRGKLFLEVGAVHTGGAGAAGAGAGGGAGEALGPCPHVMEVTVQRGKGLADRDMMGASDPYVVLQVEGHKDQQTPVQKGTLDPEWNHKVTYALNGEDDKTIRVVVFDSDPVGADFLGYGEVRATPQLLRRAVKKEQRLVVGLGPRPGNADDAKWAKGKDLGKVFLGIGAVMRAPGKAGPEGPTRTVEVVVEKGAELGKRDLVGQSDPYVVVDSDVHTGQRTAEGKGSDPVWNHTMHFDVAEGRTTTLRLLVLDKDVAGSDFLGAAEVDITPELLKKMEGEGPQHLTLQLGAREGRKDDAKWIKKLGGKGKAGKLFVTVALPSGVQRDIKQEKKREEEQKRKGEEQKRQNEPPPPPPPPPRPSNPAQDDHRREPRPPPPPPPQDTQRPARNDTRPQGTTPEENWGRQQHHGPQHAVVWTSDPNGSPSEDEALQELLRLDPEVRMLAAQSVGHAWRHWSWRQRLAVAMQIQRGALLPEEHVPALLPSALSLDEEERRLQQRFNQLWGGGPRPRPLSPHCSPPRSSILSRRPLCLVEEERRRVALEDPLIASERRRRAMIDYEAERAARSLSSAQ